MSSNCRICLRKSNSIMSRLENCIEIIKDVAQIDICVDRALPQLICSECVDRLLDARTMKELCIKSEEYYSTQIRKSQESEWDTMESVDDIKEENFEYDELEFLIDEDLDIANESLSNKQISIRCCICNQFFTDEKILASHCLSKHRWRINYKISDLNEFQCPVCISIFDESEFWTHVYEYPLDHMIETVKKEQIMRNNIKKRRQKLESSDKNILCCQCSVKFETLDEARIHLKQKHPDYEAYDEANSVKDLKCTICLASFATYDNLNSHSQLPKLLFPCMFCDQMFEKVPDVRLHFKEMHPDIPPQYKCNQCDRIYFKYCSLYSHLYKFHREDFRNNICDYCGKIFVDRSYLQNHVEVHHFDIKKFICDLCSKAFPNKTNLRSHMRSHTGEKPYKCPHCSKCYGFYTDWKTHIAGKHTGAWSIHCEICHRGFMKPSQLKIHMKGHVKI